MQLARLLVFCASIALVPFAASCDTEAGDPPAPVTVPDPAGKDQRIHEIRDPESPMKAKDGSQVQVSGAVVLAVDTYDETQDGKSTGTIYVSDLGSQDAYSGISLYNPSFIPGNLRVGPGDALDLRGQYQENNTIPVQFAPDSYLVQLSNALGTFRFDANVPEPVTKDGDRDLKIEDFSTYENGQKWLNMLVTIKNVTVADDKYQAKSGRVSYDLMPKDANAKTGLSDPFPKPPTLVNELSELPELKKGQVIKSLTGIVTFFGNLHIAPRDAKDIVL